MNLKGLLVALAAIGIVACGGSSEQAEPAAAPEQSQSTAPAENADASARKEYPLKGQVISISADRSEATIKHEEIPGYMSAMTMPYKVPEAAALEGVQPGDLIEATVVVEPAGAHLERVTKVGQAPLPAP
jgi:protein SCO1/2